MSQDKARPWRTCDEDQGPSNRRAQPGQIDLGKGADVAEKSVPLPQGHISLTGRYASR